MPAGAQIKVSGVRDVVKALRQVDKQLPRQLSTIGKAAATIVAAEARTSVPVRSGSLQSTIRPGGTQRKAVVRAGGPKAPYAGAIHFGWAARNIKPNTFLYDALDVRAQQVAAAYIRGVQKLINDAGLGAR